MSAPHSCCSHIPPLLALTTLSQESSATIKFLMSQSIGKFSGEGLHAWSYSFEDPCNIVALSDVASLNKVGSKLCDSAASGIKACYLKAEMDRRLE
ncbi:hypothetical protein DSO57_1033410 [Entomophthora muscae]|uniref:Uncharacterized protein n=1 Tax=Entomophthora muscae TaxID=34485 RepID=A0ACC2SCR1_9FUNG|nr:hypothetical protein DSO57_1033410 [Entomophthora muscae]